MGRELFLGPIRLFHLQLATRVNIDTISELLPHDRVIELLKFPEVVLDNSYIIIFVK